MSFFDYKINTKGGFVFAAIIKPIGIVQETLIRPKIKIPADKAHRILHKNDNKCNATMQSLDYQVVGKYKDKECCLKAKIKKKRVRKIMKMEYASCLSELNFRYEHIV